MKNLNLNELKLAVDCGALIAWDTEDAERGIVYSEFGKGDWSDSLILTFANGDQIEIEKDLWIEDALESLENLEDKDLQERWLLRIYGSEF